MFGLGSEFIVCSPDTGVYYLEKSFYFFPPSWVSLCIFKDQKGRKGNFQNYKKKIENLNERPIKIQKLGAKGKIRIKEVFLKWQKRKGVIFFKTSALPTNKINSKEKIVIKGRGWE